MIFSKNLDKDNFYTFLASTRWIFAKAIESNIPIKGSISCGEVSLNKEEQIYFGQPIIDAYLLQEEVNHIGIVAHNTIDVFVENNPSFRVADKIKLESLLLESKVPLKTGQLTHTFLNWFTYVIPDNKRNTNRVEKRTIVIELLNKFKLNSSGDPRKYSDNTIDFFKKIFNDNIVFEEVI